jgi:Transglutaminase-like superfamily
MQVTLADVSRHMQRRSVMSPTLQVETRYANYRRPLAKGRAGNIQTLDLEADLIRRDDGDPAFEDWANRICGNVSGHNDLAMLEKIFRYCRTQILYRRDPYGFEQVKDARRTIADGYGDCGDKTVLMATLVAALGYKPRLAVISYRLPMFQHEFVQVFVKGRWISYDPTPEEAIAGWESKGMGRWTFPIYDRGDDNDPYNLGGTNMGIVPLVIAGIKIAPMAIGLITNLFGAGKRKADETKAHDAYGAVTDAVDKLESAIKAGQLTPADAANQYQQVRAAYIKYATSTEIQVDSVRRAMQNKYDPSRCEYICATDKRAADFASLAPQQQLPPSTTLAPTTSNTGGGSGGTLAPSAGGFGGGTTPAPTYDSNGALIPTPAGTTGGFPSWLLIAAIAIAAISFMK